MKVRFVKKWLRYCEGDVDEFAASMARKLINSEVAVALGAAPVAEPVVEVEPEPEPVVEPVVEPEPKPWSSSQYHNSVEKDLEV